jgi:farnesyl diphosphate synthase
MKSRLDTSMQQVSRDIDLLFDLALPTPHDVTAKLFDAMRHAAIGGGKRLRPLLTCASAELFEVPRRFSLRAGLAVECIHVHSLIHDDLPCMDDDDWRRGKLTVHRAFDEATAVLAGDSLLAMSFEILSDPETHPLSSVRAELVCDLARAAGASGMAGGQMLDLNAGYGADVDAITRLQRLKTGALIVWSVEAGGILGAASVEQRTSLRGYAQKVGLAFQIADDLLDEEGDEQKVGKKLHKDQAQGKANFVTLLGAARARQQAEALVEQAVQHLYCFNGRATLLEDIATFAICRDH